MTYLEYKMSHQHDRHARNSDTTAACIPNPNAMTADFIYGGLSMKATKSHLDNWQALEGRELSRNQVST